MRRYLLCAWHLQSLDANKFEGTQTTHVATQTCVCVQVFLVCKSNFWLPVVFLYVSARNTLAFLRDPGLLPSPRRWAWKKQPVLMHDGRGRKKVMCNVMLTLFPSDPRSSREENRENPSLVGDLVISWLTLSKNATQLGGTKTISFNAQTRSIGLNVHHKFESFVSCIQGLMLQYGPLQTSLLPCAEIWRIVIINSHQLDFSEPMTTSTTHCTLTTC